MLWVRYCTFSSMVRFSSINNLINHVPKGYVCTDIWYMLNIFAINLWYGFFQWHFGNIYIEYWTYVVSVKWHSWQEWLNNWYKLLYLKIFIKIYCLILCRNMCIIYIWVYELKSNVMHAVWVCCILLWFVLSITYIGFISTLWTLCRWTHRHQLHS